MHFKIKNSDFFFKFYQMMPSKISSMLFSRDQVFDRTQAINVIMDQFADIN